MGQKPSLLMERLKDPNVAQLLDRVWKELGTTPWLELRDVLVGESTSFTRSMLPDIALMRMWANKFGIELPHNR